MYYRTKTYVAADWDNDIEAINQLYKWNDSDFYTKIDFINVHDFIQARDSSLYCSIKRSLNERMSMSKTFILIVGDKTNSITKGGCQHCILYNKNSYTCRGGHRINFKSYIEHECYSALRNNLNIVVLYNSNNIDYSLCPEILRDKGVHAPMKENGIYCYSKVRDAILKAENIL